MRNGHNMAWFFSVFHQSLPDPEKALEWKIEFKNTVVTQQLSTRMTEVYVASFKNMLYKTKC